MSKLTIRSGAISIEKDITGKNLLNEIRNQFPDGLNHEEIIIKVDGSEINPIEFSLNKSFDCDVELIVSPDGIDPVSIVIALVVAVVASVALRPSIPTQQQSGAIAESPNTSFSGQTNIIRLDQQEPNLYGNVISYPDLVVREGGAWEYVNQQKIIREVFLIGIGDHEINSEPKYEATPISTIPGSSYATYGPNQLVPVVQGQFNSDIVDGQTILGPNNSDVTRGVTAIDNTASYGNNTLTLNATVSANAQWAQLHSLFVNGLPFHVEFEYDTYATSDQNVCELNRVTVSGLLTSSTFLTQTNSYAIEIVGQNLPVSNCTPPPPAPNARLSVTQLIGSSLDVTLPVRTPEFQVSFDFLNGLKNSIRVAVIHAGVSGPSISYFNYSGNTSNQQFFSQKLVTSIAILTSDLEVRIVRLTNDNEDNTDRCQVSQVASNTYRNNVNYGNRTILTTNRKATEQALRFTESRVNIDVTRKTVSYSGGAVIPTLTASRSFADAILHEYTQVNGRPSTDLPLDDLYEISNRIGALGNFDHTFSDKEQDLNQKVKIIANTARCVINFGGDKWTVFRNEPGNPAVQFDSRNIASDSPEEVSYRGFQEASNDGIKLKWRNPDGNKFDYIYFRVVGDTSVRCVYSGAGLYTPSVPRYPIEVDLVGCFTETQSIDRADLECRSLIYIQETMSTKTLIDGDNVQKGQIAKHVDYWFEDISSGEIKSINGNIHESYSEIDLPLGSYFVTYTNNMGGVSNPIACELTSNTTFTAVLPDAYVANGFTIQAGSRFMISSMEQHNDTLYRVNDKILNNDGSVSFELTEYNERIYPEND